MKITPGFTVGRLTVIRDLGKRKAINGLRAQRYVKVRCVECGELREISTSNLTRMALSRCEKSQSPTGVDRVAREAEREQRRIQVAQRKEARKRHVPEEIQEEIRRLASLTEPLGVPGFVVRVWRVRDLAKNFGLPEHAILQILHGGRT